LILLDTSVLSRAFRRREPGAGELEYQESVERLMVGEQPLGMPAIVLLEILSGLRTDKAFADLQRQLVNAFAILHPTTTEYVEAARLRNKCAACGVNVSGLDCLIATQAIEGGHELFAADDDFNLIARHSALQLLDVDSLT
jgi:predicted nucleic acid-binding protein